MNVNIDMKHGKEKWEKTSPQKSVCVYDGDNDHDEQLVLINHRTNCRRKAYKALFQSFKIFNIHVI